MPFKKGAFHLAVQAQVTVLCFPKAPPRREDPKGFAVVLQTGHAVVWLVCSQVRLIAHSCASQLNHP